MRSKKIVGSNYIGWIILIAAIALIYFSYFFIYIPQQEELVKQRSFRILKEYAGNLSEKYSYYEKHLDNYNDFYKLVYLRNKGPENLQIKVKQAIANDSILQELINGLEHSIVTSKEDISNNRFGIFYQPENKSLVIEYSQESTGNLKKLLNTVLPVDKRSAKVSSSDIDKVSNQAYVHTVPISTLMQGLKFDNLLNNITLFTDSMVIYNSNLEVVNAITNPSALADSIKKQQGGIVETMSVGGEQNHVMILPFDFDRERFYLAGFITEDYYNSKTRSISGQLLIIIAGLLLLILVGMPVLKIIFLGRNERLHTYDANAAIISFILGVSVLVILTTSILRHNVYDRIAISRRLDDISQQLHRNINDNLKSITGIYRDIYSNKQTGSELAAYVRNFFSDNADTSKKYKIISADLQSKSFPVNEIFLMDSNGRIARAVTRTAFYGPITIDVSQRLYFKNIRDWPLGMRNKELEGTRYYIESIKSYNTGYAEAAISFASEDKKQQEFATPYLAITSHLPAFFDQVLPADVEFLIINEEGDVMFHSVQRKNLHENFLAETRKSNHLMDAIEHRTVGKTRIYYNEKPWLAKILPVEGTPLYHITLIDLQQTQSKNSRILFFSSYFLLATFICIFTGYFILSFIRQRNGIDKQHQWALNWLLFNPDMHYHYFFLMMIQTFILLFQIAGLFIPAKPFTMFIYQLIFIVISAYVAFVLLNNESRTFYGLLATPKAIPLLILSIAAILIIALGITATFMAVIPLAAILIVIFGMYKIPDLSDTEKQGTAFRFLKKAMSAAYNDNQDEEKVKNKNSINAVTTKKIFHIYLFLWLTGISAVPVLQHYDAVKRQEEILWQRMQGEHIARQNLKLQHNYTDRVNDDWFTRIQAEGIDNFSVGKNTDFSEDISKNICFSDKVYAWLPVPVGTGLNLNGLLYDKNPDSEWTFKKQSRNKYFLKYSRAGNTGEVVISWSPENKLNPFTWLLYFTIPIILIVVFIWFLQRYLAGNILNTDYIDWEMPTQVSWEKILSNIQQRKVLLITYTGEDYLNKTKAYYASEPVKAHPTHELMVIEADELISGQNVAEGKNELDKHPFIWVKGLSGYFRDEKKFCRISPHLQRLINNASGKLVFELPFDIDFIDETLKDRIAESGQEEKKERLVQNMYNELPNLLKDFYRHAGMNYLPEEADRNEHELRKSIDPAIENETKEKSISLKYALRFRYNYIWSHLTRIEKLILYDLADDGLLNLKNRPLLNRLMLKGLLKFDPYPRIFSKSFQYFILHAVDPAETKILEKELGKEGNWRNTKYLIWLLLIPLIGFIFIAQGTSIEKVIGILSGGVAVVAGMMRVFNSGSIKQSG